MTAENAVRAVLLRELQALKRAVDAYPDDESLWRVPSGVPNAAGTLALHLAGNMQHFIGAVLGGTGYVRDRDAEFARRDVSRADILAEIDRAIAAVDRTFTELSDSALDARFPQEVQGRIFDTRIWLLHLVSHFGYHLGQLDYHRRMVTGDPRSVNALAVADLPAIPAPGARPS